MGTTMKRYVPFPRAAVCPSREICLRARLRAIAVICVASLACHCGSDGAMPKDRPVAFDARAYFAERQRAAQEHTLSQGGTGIYEQLVRLERGEGPLDAGAFSATFEKLRARRDTSDFQLTALIRMLYQYRDSPLMTPSLRAEIEDVVLNFKYWIDEPGTDPMVYWSENHQILFHSSEYLAGQLFPEKVFPNAGLTGRQHMEKARRLLLRWMQLRAAIGFTEWHSSNYYEEDVGPLVNLVDFARDEEIRIKAAIIADLLLFDIALNSHAGVFGGSHGRTFQKNVLGGAREATAGIAHLVFGQAPYFNRTGGPSFSALSVTKDYVPAAAVILADRPEARPQVWTDRSRMGIELKDGPAYGLSTDEDDFESIMFWWSAGAYALPEVVNGTFAMAYAYGLFQEGDFFPLVRPLIPLWRWGILPDLIRASHTLGALARAISLMQTHTVAHHNPYAMLGSALDKMAGDPSFQNHSWSATLAFDVTVMTNHPMAEQELAGDYFGYYTGGASHPRIGQYRDVAIIIYNPIISWSGALLPCTQFTHAYFPFEAFDETRQIGHWAFGRKDQGYIALYSHNDVSVAEDGPFAGKELVAYNPRNVWICEIGWSGEDGSFGEFIERVLSQPVAVSQDLTVTYESDMGPITLGWTGPMSVAGRAVDLHDNPRNENPFTRVEWGQNRWTITAGGITSILDFDRAIRVVQ